MAGEDKGEESALEGIEESGLETPSERVSASSAAMVANAAAFREGAAGPGARRGIALRVEECYSVNRIVEEDFPGPATRGFRVAVGVGMCGVWCGWEGEVRSIRRRSGCLQEGDPAEPSPNKQTMGGAVSANSMRQ